jgi:hypothetical protein
MKITSVGIDLAKNVFQLHAVDERGRTSRQALNSPKGAGIEDYGVADVRFCWGLDKVPRCVGQRGAAEPGR